jgi:hypothetical protein
MAALYIEFIITQHDMKNEILNSRRLTKEIINIKVNARAGSLIGSAAL